MDGMSESIIRAACEAQPLSILRWRRSWNA